MIPLITTTYSQYAKPGNLMQAPSTHANTKDNDKAQQQAPEKIQRRRPISKREYKAKLEEASKLVARNRLSDIVDRLNHQKTIQNRDIEFQLVEYKRPMVAMINQKTHETMRHFDQRDIMLLEQGLHDMAGFQMNLVA